MTFDFREGYDHIPTKSSQVHQKLNNVSAKRRTIAAEQKKKHLDAHVVVDPKGDIPDRPLSERLRVREPGRPRRHRHGLPPARRRPLRPPLLSLPAGLILLIFPPPLPPPEHLGRVDRRGVAGRRGGEPPRERDVHQRRRPRCRRRPLRSHSACDRRRCAPVVVVEA